jgi:hypothetical protein
MNLPTKIDRGDPLVRSRRNSLQAGDPVSVRPAAFEPNEDSTDYQNFSAESRAAEVRTYQSRPILPLENINTSSLSDNERNNGKPSCWNEGASQVYFSAIDYLKTRQQGRQYI